MVKIASRWIDLRYLDNLSAQNTVIHRLDPSVKLITTLIFIVITSSFPKYEVTALIPLIFFPLALVLLGNLPWKHLLKRLLLVAPFVVLLGMFNPLFDQTPVMQIHSMLITGGWLSFLSITLRFTLTVSAALILVATTGMNAICAALSRMGVPKVIVTQLLIMYRYLHVLLDEVVRAMQAYSLRSFHGARIHYRAWGSLLGQLLMHTLERARRIYQAMLCRGFEGDIRILRTNKTGAADIAYAVGWVAFFLLARFFNIPHVLGNILLGVCS